MIPSRIRRGLSLNGRRAAAAGGEGRAGSVGRVTSRAVAGMAYWVNVNSAVLETSLPCHGQRNEELRGVVRARMRR